MSMELRDRISPGLARLAKGIENKKPILEAMGLQFESLTKRAFNEPSLRPRPWPNKRDGSPATLRRNQVLVRSIRIASLTNTHVSVATDRIYGAIHQFGGVIRPKNARALAFQLGGRMVFAQKVTIPPRPFFPFIEGRIIDSARRKIEAVGEAKIRALLAGPGTA